MTLKEFFSSGADSPDHKNFKIKPFNSIFDSSYTAETREQTEGKSSRKGYPPPVLPKMEN